MWMEVGGNVVKSRKVVKGVETAKVSWHVGRVPEMAKRSVWTWNYSARTRQLVA